MAEPQTDEPGWRGRCEDPLGLALRRVRVTVALLPDHPPSGSFAAPPPVVFETRTDARGHFEIRAQAIPVSTTQATELLATFEHRDFPAVVRTLDPAGLREALQLGALTLSSASQTLRVRIINGQDASPVAGARVESTPLLVDTRFPENNVSALTRHATTGPDGLAFVPVDPTTSGGPLRVTARMSGFATTTTLVDPLSADDFDPGSTTVLAIERAVTLQGSFRTAAGRPIDADITVTGTEDGRPVVLARARTGAAGSFRLPGLPAAARGALSLRLRSGYGDHAAGTVVRVVELSLTRALDGSFDLTLPATPIARGRLVWTRAGGPVPGAEVRAVHAIPGSQQGLDMEVLAVVRTDRRGNFILHGFADPQPRGRITLEVSSSSATRHRADIPFSMDTSANMPPVVLDIPRPGAVHGIVVAEESSGGSTPLAGAAIHLHRAEAAVPSQALAVVRSAPDGHFRIEDVPAGTFRTWVTADGYAPAWSPMFGTGETGTVTARIPTLRPGATMRVDLARAGYPDWLEIRPSAGSAGTPPTPSRWLSAQLGDKHLEFTDVGAGSWDVLYHWVDFQESVHHAIVPDSEGGPTFQHRAVQTRVVVSPGDFHFLPTQVR